MGRDWICKIRDRDGMETAGKDERRAPRFEVKIFGLDVDIFVNSDRDCRARPVWNLESAC